MSNFFSKMESNLNYNSIQTENGAKSYKTTGEKLVDLNYKTSSFRNMSDEEIRGEFLKAYAENPIYATVWAFFARDIRGGMGERRTFRVCLEEIIKRTFGKLPKESRPGFINILCELIMEYGRADDLYVVEKAGYSKQFADFVRNQLEEDMTNMVQNKPISLMAKWLKSESASSKESKLLAKKTIALLGWNSAQYRKTLSSLRKYLDVVETKMSSNNWTDIDYEKVPSKASLIYKEAFNRHDEQGYQKFVKDLESGKAKVNAKTLYPYEILAKYRREKFGYYSDNYRTGTDETLEAMWKALPFDSTNNTNTLVVADGSGSMRTRLGKGETCALDVAQSLAILFAERATGPYKNKYITFSANPKFVDLSGCTTLKDKIAEAEKHHEYENTNIRKVFELILDTAITCKLKQEELPQNIVVISDMEFDEGSDCSGSTTFEYLESKYEERGYKLPRLIFWNTCSRTCGIPIKENDRGVALVSGFSQNIAQMVLGGELDAKQNLINILESERYLKVKGFAYDLQWSI